MELGKELKTEVSTEGNATILKVTGHAGNINNNSISTEFMQELLSKTDGDIVLLLSIKDNGARIRTSGGVQTVDGGTDVGVVEAMIHALKENIAVLEGGLDSARSHQK